jgi:pilus assembly protein Flp/PilA
MFLFISKSKREKGQGLVEYAIILALVAIVVVGVMRVLGPRIGNTFSTINNSLPGGVVSAPAAPAVIEGDAARAQYCAERPGWTGGVNWGFAGGYTWTTSGQTYHVTGAPFNCPYP